MRFKKIAALTIVIIAIITIKSCEPDEHITTPFELNVPYGFPSFSVPDDNPLTVEGVELGKYLFYEKALSSNFQFSCSDCHNQQMNFSSPSNCSGNVFGLPVTRNTMPLVNLVWDNAFAWDERKEGLENKITDAYTNPFTMAGEIEEIVNRLQNNNFYVDLFYNAFGDGGVNEINISKALAQFLRTIITGNSKFDKFLRGEMMLTVQELNGYEIFNREARTEPSQPAGGDCFHCHGAPLFTDLASHNNGLDSVFSDLGLAYATNDTMDYGKFKTPTLRNVEFTSPYMHDGRFLTLEEVIEHYNSGGIDSYTIDPLMKRVGIGLLLTESEKQDLIAFIRTLKDEDFLINPDYSNPNI